MATSEAKTAEFAKLFDLFEMLATRRSRRTTAQSSPEDARAIPVPADLEPVFQSLATVVAPPSGRRRRNTVAALGLTTSSDSDDDSDSDDESVAKFPLGKRYSFRFKMMIHKLYEVDEWAEKVREVLLASRLEYKPLAEQEVAKKIETPAGPSDGRVHFKAEVTVRGKKSMSLAPTRSRSHSVTGPARLSGSARLQVPAAVSSTVPNDGHAVKKRCIGRRKSESGPTSSIGGGWIYDAAVSSAEIRERVTVPIEATSTLAAQTGPRPRYQSLQTGSRRMGAGPRRIVSAVTTNPGPAVDSAPRCATKRRLSE